MKDVLLYDTIDNCLKMAFYHCAKDYHSFYDICYIKLDSKIAGVHFSPNDVCIDVFDAETGEMITSIVYRMSETGGIKLTFIDFDIPEDWQGHYASPCSLGWSFDGVQYYAHPCVD